MSTTTFASRVRRVLLVTTTSALLAGVVTVTGDAAAAPIAPLAPAAGAASKLVATTTVSVAAQRAATAYWTPQRLHAAADVSTMTLPGSASKTTTTAKAPHPDGPAGRVAGVAPSSPAPSTGGATTNGTPLINAWVSPTKYTLMPYSMNGKIFFTFNGGGYQCSGTSVTSFVNGVQESKVWTAGHCLANEGGSNPGTWNSNVVFIPGFNGDATTTAGREPFGAFPLIQASTAWNWLNHGQASVDLGAFTVGTSTIGRVLYKSVGAAGFMWNQNPVQTFDAFGYPVLSPYNGNYQYHYRATTSKRHTWPGGQGQPMLGMANPMTGGSSGGAWFVGWSTTSSGWINGHNDWKFDDASMYSPYFDTLANQVRCFGPVTC